MSHRASGAAAGGPATEIADGAVTLGDVDASVGTIADATLSGATLSDPTLSGAITGLPSSAPELPPVAGGAKTANYAMQDGEVAVLFDTVLDAYTCTLPTPAAGLLVVVGQIAIAEGVSVAPHGAEKINGVAGNYDIGSTRVELLWCDGTDWYVLGT